MNGNAHTDKESGKQLSYKNIINQQVELKVTIWMK